MQDNGGERELVLGNKQLLAIFFVAALLCGVFFAVGYVVGGNSAKAGAAALVADGSSASTSDGKHEEPQPQSTTETSQVTNQTSTPASTNGGGTLPAAEPMVSNNPAAAGAQPSTIPPAPVPVPVAPAPKPAAQVVPATKPEVQAAKLPAAGVFISVPEAGTAYWQVHAIGRPTADDLVRALREGGLPAILAESSKPALFRVLVGPYRSPSMLADAKRKLTELGYAPVVQKY
jgi:hypothetical protein